MVTKADFSPNRLKAALPFFMVLLVGFSLFLGLFLLVARHQLVKTEMVETNRLLLAYLQRGSAAPLQFGQGLSVYDEQLGGLDFIRISKSNNRLLLAGDAISASLFHELLRLEPLEDAPWLRLAGEDRETIWSVVSKTPGSGVVITAGRDSSFSYRQYRQLLLLVMTGWCAGLVLSLTIALFCVRRLVSPLVKLRVELETLMAEGREQLLPEKGGDTEREQLYRQVNRLIRQNRRLVSEMQASLDNVAHDLRTPMTRLRSVAEFGLREESDIEKLRESLADCLEESERVLSMLRIMMSVAEAETGTIQLEYTRLDLAESIGEMVSLYEYVAEERRVTLSCECRPGLTIQADRTRIAQVWANLLDNGIKYGREGGFVQVETASAGTMVCVRFRDNGMGISASEQPRIWERLYRGDRSRSQQGLGLGLNFVKAIVEAHGGTVQVESVLHEGSCFTVMLPMAEAQLLEVGSMEKSQTSGEWSESFTSGI
ncbi:sensor histidine kinase [Desulfopila aestuarii]|uniref:sensor histidine kinase n=1 Tax=Desulfopila aestuarii TaxID=231440 RepID=UPI0013562B0C|nr:HAMP domain-containing sensor histidine kinase [Desulfopila aestuarii]